MITAVAAADRNLGAAAREFEYRPIGAELGVHHAVAIAIMADIEELAPAIGSDDPGSVVGSIGRAQRRMPSLGDIVDEPRRYVVGLLVRMRG